MRSYKDKRDLAVVKDSWSIITPRPLKISTLNIAETCYVLAVAGFFSLGVLTTLGSGFANFLPFITPDGFAAVAIHVPFFLYILFQLRAGLPVRIGAFIVLYFLLLILMLFSLARHPEYSEVMFDDSWNGNINSVLFSLTAPVVGFLLVTAAPKVSLVVKGFEYAAYLTFAGNIVRFLQSTIRGHWIQYDSLGREFAADYDLGFGYSVLFSVVVFTFLAFSGRRPAVHLAASFTGILMIVLGGSRAPLGFAVIAIAVFAIYFRRRLFFNSPARVLFATVLIVLATSVMLSMQRILEWASDLLKRSDFESRTLDRLIEGTYTEDRARDTLSDISDELVNSGGLLGHGLYGDRFVIRERYRWGYPHNILDELQITFGAVGGITLFLCLIVLLLTALWRARGTHSADLIVLLFPLTFQLWVSYSYLLSSWFWALLGAIWLAFSDRKQTASYPSQKRNRKGKLLITSY